MRTTVATTAAAATSRQRRCSRSGSANDTYIVSSAKASIWNTAKVGGLFVVAAAVSLTCIWALWAFLIKDHRLALDYLRTLIWPTVVVMVLYWLRTPVRQKVSQLLRFDAFGTTAEFSPEAQGRELENVLHNPVASLLSTIPNGQQDEAEEGDNSTAPDTGTTETTPSEPTKPSHAPEVAINTATKFAAEHSEIMDDLLSLGRLAGTKNLAIARRLHEGNPAKARQLLISMLRRRIYELNRQHSQRQDELRTSLESVIRKSSSWGYEMGVAGAPKVVPDIEWNDDGSWRITTEIPRVHRAKTALEHEKRSTRQIVALENEIKELVSRV